MKVAERFEVAQSLFRIASGIAKQQGAVLAAHAGQRVRTSPMTAHVEKARRIANAATQAAMHAVSKSVTRHVDGEAPVAPEVDAIADTELDHETLHDDAC